MSLSRCGGRVTVHLQARPGHAVLSPTLRYRFRALSDGLPPSASCSLQHISDQGSCESRRPSCFESDRHHRLVSGLGSRWSSIIRQSLATKSPARHVRAQAHSCSHGRGYSTSAEDKTIKGVTFMDIFAGIGGMGLALTKQGCTCVYANEIDPTCADTYERNHCRGGPGIPEVDRRDIRRVTRTMSRASCMLPIATIACGGFPCQSMSNNGNREGLDDEKNGDLIFEFVKLLIHLQNPIVFLENVKDFATVKKSERIDVAQKELEAAGYYVSSHIYNAVDFNLAQNRERCFIVAVREDLAAGPFECEFGRDQLG